MVSISAKTVVQGVVFLALLAALWFYNQKAENLALTLARIQAENAVLLESERRLRASWAHEAGLRAAGAEKQREVSHAMQNIDTSWGTSRVHDSVISVLRAAGIIVPTGPPTVANAPTGDEPSGAPNQQ